MVNNKDKKTSQLAVLISNAGTGTNLQAIIDSIVAQKINAQILVVVSDNENAYGLERAKKHNIQTHILRGENLVDLLQRIYVVDYIALAGWKKIISDEMIDKFPNKIINIHPGLIPTILGGLVKNPDGTQALWNKGKFTTKAIENFLKQKSTYAGSTIHFLTKEFDFGPVLGKCFEPIMPNDSIETLYGRLKRKENKLYVEVLKKLCNG